MNVQAFEIDSAVSFHTVMNRTVHREFFTMFLLMCKSGGIKWQIAENRLADEVAKSSECSAAVQGIQKRKF